MLVSRFFFSLVHIGYKPIWWHCPFGDIYVTHIGVLFCDYCPPPPRFNFLLNHLCRVHSVTIFCHRSWAYTSFLNVWNVQICLCLCSLAKPICNNYDHDWIKWIGFARRYFTVHYKDSDPFKLLFDVRVEVIVPTSRCLLSRYRHNL